MSNQNLEWNIEKPLAKVTCSSYDCERDLHSFRRRRPRNLSYRSERCFSCDAQLVDWDRLDKHDVRDVENTFESLRRELIRHHFWHTTLDDKALRHAEKKGVAGLREAAEHRLRKNVALPSSQLYRDGAQTPREGNVIYYAQHATATCCRKCIEVWHGIDRETPLQEAEIGYMTELIMRYIETRLPALPPDGSKLGLRQADNAKSS